MKHLLGLLFLLPLSHWAWAQQGLVRTQKQNTLFGQVLSRDLLYSVNLDHVFYTKTKTSLAYDVGFAVGGDGFGLPLGISSFIGKSDHHLEFNLTLIPYIDHYQTFLNGSNYSDKYLYLIPGAGYRYQRKGGGLFGRVLLSPLIFLDPPSDNFWKMDPKVYTAAILGVGYSF